MYNEHIVRLRTQHCHHSTIAHVRWMAYFRFYGSLNGFRSYNSLGKYSFRNFVVMCKLWRSSSRTQSFYSILIISQCYEGFCLVEPPFLLFLSLPTAHLLLLTGNSFFPLPLSFFPPRSTEVSPTIPNSAFQAHISPYQRYKTPFS